MGDIKFSSNQKPKFLLTYFRDVTSSPHMLMVSGRFTLQSCCLDPITKNSVLFSFNFSLFTSINSAISLIQLSNPPKQSVMELGNGYSKIE